MPRHIGLKICDVTVALISANRDCEFQVDERFEHFVTDDQPDVVLHVHCGRMPDLKIGQPVFDTGRWWSLYRYCGRWVLRVHSAYSYPLALFGLDFHAGDIYVRPSESDPHQVPFPLRYPMGDLFMINLLSRGHGVLLHACGVKDQAGGLVFAGTGGAGKSTIARRWEGRKGVDVLSDDRVILGQREGRFWVYGTPWPGEGGMFSPDAGPVQGIFLIRQASKNWVVPLSPVEAASRLLVHSFPTFWDPEGMAFTVDFLTRLGQEVPCYELGFVPDKSVVDFVRCLT